MEFYASKRQSADVLITKYGTAMTLLNDSAGESFNVVTGIATAGTPVAYNCTGIIFPSREVRKGGMGEVQGDEQTVYLSAENLTYVPKIGNRLQVSTQTFEVTSVEPLAPAGISVLYTLRVVL